MQSRHRAGASNVGRRRAGILEFGGTREEHEHSRAMGQGQDDALSMGGGWAMRSVIGFQYVERLVAIEVGRY